MENKDKHKPNDIDIIGIVNYLNTEEIKYKEVLHYMKILIDMNIKTPGFIDLKEKTGWELKQSKSGDEEFTYQRTEEWKNRNVDIKRDHARRDIIRTLKKSVDYVDILEQVIKQHPFYYDNNKMWWMWNHNENFWQLTDETDILLIIRESLDIQSIAKGSIRTEILESLKLAARKNKPKDPPVNFIHFKNYIYDLETDKKFIPSPKHFFTNPIKWDLGQSEETPVLDKLFGEWVGKDNIKQLYEIISYCLYRDYPIARIFCMIGSGRNGKSTFLQLLKNFIGNKNTCSTSLDTLLERPFETFKLFKKLTCIMGETNYTALKKTDLLKRLCGKDLIGFEKKGKDGFDDYNYAKIFIATNGIPITFDKSDGFYRRWMIIDFNNKFEKEENILQKIPKEEYENLCFKSVKLLKELIYNGKFDNELNIEDKQKMYEEKSNPITLFLKKYTENNFDGFIFKFELKEKILHYLKENNHRSYTESELNQILKDSGLEDSKKYTDDGKHRYWAWKGITFLSSVRSKQSKKSSNSHLESHIEKEVETSGLVGPVGPSPLNFDIFIEKFPEKIKINDLQEFYNKYAFTSLQLMNYIDNAIKKGAIAKHSKTELIRI